MGNSSRTDLVLVVFTLKTTLNLKTLQYWKPARSSKPAATLFETPTRREFFFLLSQSRPRITHNVIIKFLFTEQSYNLRDRDTPTRRDRSDFGSAAHALAASCEKMFHIIFFHKLPTDIGGRYLP